jgi:hypothetical protein
MRGGLDEGAVRGEGRSRIGWDDEGRWQDGVATGGQVAALRDEGGQPGRA